MRALVLVAMAVLGLSSPTPSISQASPVGGVTTIETPDHIAQVKKGGHKFKGPKGWKHSRHWNRGHGYGRYYGGPPPHARAYGRRAHDFGYYRYW